jgi:hypothetical protein
MKSSPKESSAINRRNFFALSAAGLSGLVMRPTQEKTEEHAPEKKPPPPGIDTNIDEIRVIPRREESLPGKWPGRVVKIHTPGASDEGTLNLAQIKGAVEKGLQTLTGKSDIGQAWREFVGTDDIVGIKVNPIGGRLLSTKPEIVRIIIDGLLQAGLPKKNILIWDRRRFQLYEAGFTPESFPGIRILGTEMKGPNDSFFDDQDLLWSRDNIDREYTPYTAGTEMSYGKNTLPYMINEGQHSYFTKIVTRECTKIINVPVLKNAGVSVTLCLKNLSYGSLSNTSRLHKLWEKSVAEPCVFPCLRDKVVLNIVDGLQACYDGGPAANAQFIWDANLFLLGTDPVAVDAIGLEFISKERVNRGISDPPSNRNSFLDIAGELGLGIKDRTKIQVEEFSMPA